MGPVYGTILGRCRARRAGGLLACPRLAGARAPELAARFRVDAGPPEEVDPKMLRSAAAPDTSTRRWTRRGGTFAVLAAATAALVVGPVSAAVADTSVTSITDLANAFATQPSGSTITLDADLTGDDTSDTVKVPAGRTLTLDLNGHRLTLVGDDATGTAGLGVPAGTTLTIIDSAPGGAVGALDATGSYGGGGAAIGGAAGEAAGTIVIDGGAITARGEFDGAGIGGGGGGAGGATTINGGTVTATGGDFAAGIGGGRNSAGGTVVINGGTVTASNNNEMAAAIGGGYLGSGASVSIGAGAVVTVGPGFDGYSVIGPGVSAPDSTNFGSLSNAGTLILPPMNRLVIPSGVTVTNAGTIGNGGVLEVAGTLANTGIILNTTPANPTPILNPANVTGHNATVLLDGNGGTAPADPAVVYAGTFQDGQIDFPADATRTGFTFDGWFTQAVGGTQVTATTDLGLGGPKSVTLYARWSDPTAAVIDDDSPELAATGSDALGLGLAGAALLLIGLALHLRGRRRIAD
jgi:uncharacterized repeat protein (TIGR02543 family)/LPXTG-motif cell wall-anchored protein